MAFILPVLVLLILILVNVIIYKSVISKYKLQSSKLSLGRYEKKYSSIKLENYKPLFFFNALFLSMLFAFAVIEYPTFEKTVKEFSMASDIMEEQIIDIPITEMPPPPPPKKIKAPEIVEVPDDEIIEEQPEIEIEQEEEPIPIDDFSDEIVEEIEEEKITPILDLTDVQQPPYFPGGESALYKYISENFTWPSRDIEEGNEGRVFVQFVVDQNGEIVDVKVARGINERLNSEAIRVIKGMPRWSPGKNGGVPVKVRYMIPVVLKLK